MGTVYLAADLNLGLNTPDHLDTRDEGDGQKGTRAREEVRGILGMRHEGGRQDVETGAFLFFLLYFICDSICLSGGKSISDDNPVCSTESQRVPESWESCCWRRRLISAE